MIFAKAVDKAVEDSEPGMLVHTLDVDPTCKLTFTWCSSASPMLYIAAQSHRWPDVLHSIVSE